MKNILISILTLIIFNATIVNAQTNVYSLDSCKALAIENNIDISSQKLEVELAKYTKKQAFTNYFPKVSATSGGFIANKHLIDVDINDIDIELYLENQHYSDILTTLYNTYGVYFQNTDLTARALKDGVFAGITAVQPVFAGGRIVTGNKLANLGITASEYQIELYLKDILLKTESAFWQIISLEEKLTTINVAKSMLDTIYKDVTGAAEAGLITNNNVLTVKLKIHEINSNLLRLNNGIKLAKMALCQQIGIEYNDSIKFVDNIATIENPEQIKKVHAEVLPNRIEYKLLNLSVEAENLQKRMKLGEVLPQAAVGVGYMYNNFLEKHNANLIGFFTVSIPISDWWQNKYSMKYHKTKCEIAAQKRDDMQEKLMLQMQLAWNELVEAYSQVQLLEKTIDEAEANLKLVNDNYQAGMVSVSELLQSQTLLQQSKDQYTDAKINYKIKYLMYKQMVGD